MQEHVLTFGQFIHESKINEMPRPHHSRRFSGRSFRSSYRPVDHPFVDDKDRMRARELNLGVHGKVDDTPGGGKQTVNKSAKMAKAITDTGKLLGRMTAIYAEYPENYAVLQPFVDRVLELLPRSKYEAAYRIGKNDGRLNATLGTDNYDVDSFDMNDMGNVFAELGLAPPTSSFQGNDQERIMYEFGYREGEKEGVAA